MKQLLQVIFLFCAIGLVFWVRNVAQSGPGSLESLFIPPEIEEGSAYDATTGQFIAPRSKFKVILPGPPKDDHRYHLGFTNTAGSVSVDSPDISYFIGRPITVTYMGARPEQNSLVDNGATSFVEMLHGRESRRSPAEAAGYNFIGRDVEGTLQDGRLFRLRYFVNTANYTRYIVAAVGKRESMQLPQTQRFFHSFRFI